MSDAAATPQTGSPEEAQVDNTPLPSVRIERPSFKLDLATTLGVFFALSFIVGAIAMGSGNADFINLPSVLIVVCGTIAATAISYSGEELRQSGKIFGQSFRQKIQSPTKLAAALIDMAVVAKKKGVLALSGYEGELSKDKFLQNAMQMVIDGYNPKDIDFLLTQEIEAEAERHKRSSSIAKRASEIAPAMGLIGTLVGLVQMLANLENPETIGPAMAVALLTTFYGAILGMVILAPLGVKLEKRGADEYLLKRLIKTACVSISSQDNPRKLEMLINAELPAAKRIRYFD